MPRTKWVAKTLLAVWLTLVAPAAFANVITTGEAEVLVEALHGEVLAIISDPTLSIEESKPRFREIIGRYFDVPWMVRFVMGSHWRTATRAQRAEFVQLYLTLTVDNYSRNLSGSSALSVQVVGSRLQGRGRRAIVTTEIHYPSTASVLAIQWVVSKRGDASPRIIDIVFAGISFLATKREEFSSAIQRHRRNINAVLGELRRQVGGL